MSDILPTMDMQSLIARASDARIPISFRDGGSGLVGCALETSDGEIFTGVNIDVPCSMGFCAEHAAVAAMLGTGRTRIVRIATVYKDGRVIPPCGRCRELLSQIDHGNLEADVAVTNDDTMTLRELLPMRWDAMKTGD